MNIRIIAVGRIKEKYLREGIAEYTKRLTPFCKLEIVEVQDEPFEGYSPSQLALAKAREGERILKAIKPGQWVIALDVKGKMVSSEALAEEFEGLALKGRSDVAILIGGAAGYSPEVLNRADFRLSISPMTFTHQMARLILMEQVYRAFKIRRGEPYHLGD